jgi:hypothetical protein
VQILSAPQNTLRAVPETSGAAPGRSQEVPGSANRCDPQEALQSSAITAGARARSGLADATPGYGAVARRRAEPRCDRVMVRMRVRAHAARLLLHALHGVVEQGCSLKVSDVGRGRARNHERGGGHGRNGLTPPQSGGIVVRRSRPCHGRQWTTRDRQIDATPGTVTGGELSHGRCAYRPAHGSSRRQRFLGRSCQGVAAEARSVGADATSASESLRWRRGIGGPSWGPPRHRQPSTPFRAAPIPRLDGYTLARALGILARDHYPDDPPAPESDGAAHQPPACRPSIGTGPGAAAPPNPRRLGSDGDLGL